VGKGRQSLPVAVNRIPFFLKMALHRLNKPGGTMPKIRHLHQDQNRHGSPNSMPSVRHEVINSGRWRRLLSDGYLTLASAQSAGDAERHHHFGFRSTTWR